MNKSNLIVSCLIGVVLIQLISSAIIFVDLQNQIKDSEKSIESSDESNNKSTIPDWAIEAEKLYLNGKSGGTITVQYDNYNNVHTSVYTNTGVMAGPDCLLVLNISGNDKMIAYGNITHITYSNPYTNPGETIIIYSKY